ENDRVDVRIRQHKGLAWRDSWAASVLSPAEVCKAEADCREVASPTEAIAPIATQGHCLGVLHKASFPCLKRLKYPRVVPLRSQWKPSIASSIAPANSPAWRAPAMRYSDMEIRPAGANEGQEG